MIELKLKRDEWMSNEGYESLKWTERHRNLTIVGASASIRFFDFRIQGRIFKYNSKGFRSAFQKEQTWEKISR